MIRSAPYYINWNYTYACNFNCSHCYTRAPKYPDELDTQAYHQIVDQLIDLQVFRIGLGGGEPIVRADCLEMISRMGHAGIYVLLTSNGWFIDQRMAADLKKAKLGLLALSIDSIIPEKHDVIRKQQNSFERVLKAAKHSVDVGLNVYLAIVLNKTNMDELDDLMELAEQLNVAGIHFKLFRPGGNGLKNLDKYQLTNEEVDQIVEQIENRRPHTDLDLSLYQKDGSKGFL